MDTGRLEFQKVTVLDWQLIILQVGNPCRNVYGKLQKKDGKKTETTTKNFQGGGNWNIFGIFTPNLGEMIQFHLRIFFRWVVGSTTN